MMRRATGISLITCAFWLIFQGTALAGGLLDGRVFEGLIGPVEKPDLPDSLHFDGGFFWSDICTACGFKPGAYVAEQTEEGIAFRGALQSDSGGRFDYDGLVRDDGSLYVRILWEKKRWYWTARREIAFSGVDTNRAPLRLEQIRAKMAETNPSANPRCARF